MQRKNLKKVLAANAAKQCKNQVQRTQLRAEEQYHFNRITSGFLAENLVDHFKKFQQAPMKK